MAQRKCVNHALNLWRQEQRASAVAAVERAKALELTLSARESEAAELARRRNIFPDSSFEAFVGYVSHDSDDIALPFENRDSAVAEILGTMVANFDLAEAKRASASDTKFNITTMSQMWGSGKTALVANFTARARTLYHRGMLPAVLTAHARFREALDASVVSIDLRFDSPPPTSVDGLNVWVNDTVCRALASLMSDTRQLETFRSAVRSDIDCKRTEPCANRLIKHFSTLRGGHARVVLHFDEIDKFLELGRMDGTQVLMVFWGMMVDLLNAGAHVIFSGRTTYLCSMHALAVAQGGPSPTATLPLLLPPLSCAHVASILHGCAADFNAERSAFKFNTLLAIDGTRTGKWLNLNDREVVDALARTIYELTRGIPRFVKYAIAYMWSTGDGALGTDFDALLERRAKCELTLRCPDGSSGLLHQLLLFAALRVPFDPLMLIEGRHVGDPAGEAQTLALSICKSFNFYIAPLPEVPGRWIVELPPIYLRILSHCATPSMGMALMNVVRRQDLAGRVSGAPFERALTVMLAEIFALSGEHGLNVGAAVAGLGGGLVDAYVLPHAAVATRHLPKFVAQRVGIKDEAEVAVVMENVAAGQCKQLRIENWPHVLRFIRASGMDGYFVPCEKSCSADSYLFGRDYAIGIQQKDNRVSGPLTLSNIGTEAAKAFPQALMDAVEGPCSFVVAQTAVLPTGSALLAGSQEVRRGDRLVGSRWCTGATLGIYVVPPRVEITLLNPEGVHLLLGDMNAAAFLEQTDNMFTGLLLTERRGK